MPTISVIVPVYNVEKYLRRCVDSILAQTFTDIEVLLVDDGSTDGSGTICDEYAQQDSRVRVFHKANGGVSSARNLGLDEATGKWIAFVDSDDYIGVTLYEKIMDVSTEQDAVYFHFSTDNDGNITKIYQKKLRSLEQTPRSFSGFYHPREGEIRNDVFYDNSLAVFSFRAIYKKSFVDEYGIRFDTQQKTGEDRIFTYRVLLKARKVTVVDDEFGYYYFKRGVTSLTGEKDAQYYRKGVFQNHQRMDLLEQELCADNVAMTDSQLREIRLFRANKMLQDVVLNEFKFNAKNAAIQIEQYRKDDFFRFAISFCAAVDALSKKRISLFAKIVLVKLRFYGVLTLLYLISQKIRYILDRKKDL